MYIQMQMAENTSSNRKVNLPVAAGTCRNSPRYLIQQTYHNVKGADGILITNPKRRIRNTGGKEIELATLQLNPDNALLTLLLALATTRLKQETPEVLDLLPKVTRPTFEGELHYRSSLANSFIRILERAESLSDPAALASLLSEADDPELASGKIISKNLVKKGFLENVPRQLRIVSFGQ